MVRKLLKKYYHENCTDITFSMPKTITQIRPDDRTKGERKTQNQKQ